MKVNYLLLVHKETLLLTYYTMGIWFLYLTDSLHLAYTLIEDRVCLDKLLRWFSSRLLLRWLGYFKQTHEWIWWFSKRGLWLWNQGLWWWWCVTNIIVAVVIVIIVTTIFLRNILLIMITIKRRLLIIIINTLLRLGLLQEYII